MHALCGRMRPGGSVQTRSVWTEAARRLRPDTLCIDGAPLRARRWRIVFADETALDAVAGAIVPVKGQARVEGAAILIFAVQRARAPRGPVVEAILVRGSAAAG